jgi:hypothetical protein
VSDHYFEVGELTFPKGKASEWLATVTEVFATLEGDVETKLVGERFVARILLIDAAYFQAQDALGAALDAAAKAGAKGTWYSGDHLTGTRSTLAAGKRKLAKRAEAAAVQGWIDEAHAVAARNAAPARKPKKRKR